MHHQIRPTGTFFLLQNFATFAFENVIFHWCEILLAYGFKICSNSFQTWKRAFNLKTNETNNWQNDFQLIGYWKSAQSIILAIIIAIIGRPINYCKPLPATLWAAYVSILLSKVNRSKKLARTEAAKRSQCELVLSGDFPNSIRANNKN